MTSNDKILERVRALIAKAEGTSFPEEADAFRAKADQLMQAHAISEWDVKEAAGAKADKITNVMYNVDWWGNKSVVRTELWDLIWVVAQHCRVKIVTHAYAGRKGIPVVGLESDIAYFDLLFTSLMLELSMNLEPKPDPDKPMIENLVRMKEAGMKWERIGELLVKVGQLDEYNRNVGVKFTKLYTAYCDEHNRPRLRVNPVTYQRSFAAGFEAEVARRLRDMRDKTKQAEPKGSGSDLVVRDIRLAVNEKALELYGVNPYRGGSGSRRNYDGGGMEAGNAAGAKANLQTQGGKLRNTKRLGA